MIYVEREFLQISLTCSYRQQVLEKIRLLGYFKTWFVESLNLDDPAVRKGYDLKEARVLRTKQQIWDKAAKMAAKTKHTKDTMDRRITHISRKVYHYEDKKRYEEKKQQLMEARKLADESTKEGGFMSQVGTNLVSRVQSTKKAVRELIIPSEVHRAKVHC